MPFAQPVILITGASRGIGAATAQLAAERGYAVGVNYRRQKEAAETVARAVEELGGTALLLPGDMSREEDILKVFAGLDEAFGRLDGLVNNAGVLDAQARVESMTTQRIERILKTNVLGPFLCCREAIRRMSKARGGQGGAIVNVSSVAARLGSPGEYVDYAASKGAIDALTVGLAKEVAAEGIRVNAVRPGFIYTDIHADGGEPQRVERVASSLPMGRGGQAVEVAQAILWLLSPEASYVTGSFTELAGGR